MSIAIIGSGNVRSALGRGWLRAAEDVVFGVRNPADPKYNPLPRERLLTPQRPEIRRLSSLRHRGRRLKPR